MKLWRIAAETRTYPATDMSGGGAAQKPGRWNGDKEPIIYSSQTISMAVLETAAHIDDTGLPLNRYLIEITVPEPIWENREVVNVKKLPSTWAAIPAGRASVKFGSDWLSSLRAAILVVPSVIVPEESVVLINPRHAEAPKIKAKSVRLFEYNRLFRV
jgi:RES domain-containing protein